MLSQPCHRGNGHLQDKLMLLIAALAVIVMSAAFLFPTSEMSDAADGPSVGYEFSADGLKYKVTSIQEAQLVGYDKISSSLEVPAKVSLDGIDLRVSSIGDRAFFGCVTITTADLGDIAEIGRESFAGCAELVLVECGTSLESIGDRAFSGCSKLHEVDIVGSAKTMRTIGSYAFSGCERLSSIAIPSYMTKLGENAFSVSFADKNGKELKPTLKALKGYEYEGKDKKLVRQAGPVLNKEYSEGKMSYRVIGTLPAELEVAGPTKEFRNITVPESLVFDGYEFKVTAIGDKAFKNFVKIRTISMPSIEEIGKEAFYGCRYIIPKDLDSIRSIGVKAFANCVNMKEVSFGDSLEKISAYAFYSCRTIESVDIPDSVSLIGSYAFFRCYSLENVTLGESLERICSYTFSKTPIKEIAIPSTVTKIGAYAFKGCTELTAVDFDTNEVSLGTSAFASCPSIVHIAMPDVIKKLGAGAFDEQVFRHSDGSVMEATAKNLSGKTFYGEDKALSVFKEQVVSSNRIVRVDYNSLDGDEIRAFAGPGCDGQSCEYCIYDSDGNVVLSGACSISEGSYRIRVVGGTLSEGSYKLFFDNSDVPYGFDVYSLTMDGNLEAPVSQEAYISSDSLSLFEAPSEFVWSTESDGSGRFVDSLSELAFDDYRETIYAFEKPELTIMPEMKALDDSAAVVSPSVLYKKGIKDMLKHRSSCTHEIVCGGCDQSYWNEQALKIAREYLDSSPFSKEGLIAQLLYDKFTEEEAAYAIQRCAGDWMQEALEIANSYLEAMSFSKEGLADQLLYKKFTEAEAEYAVDNCEADWDQEALDKANECLGGSNLSREGLRERLLCLKFTEDEAEYAVDNCEADWNKKAEGSPSEAD